MENSEDENEIPKASYARGESEKLLRSERRFFHQNDKDYGILKSAQKGLITKFGSARSHSGFGTRFVKMARPDIDIETANQIFEKNLKARKVLEGSSNPSLLRNFMLKEAIERDEKILKSGPGKDVFSPRKLQLNST